VSLPRIRPLTPADAPALAALAGGAEGEPDASRARVLLACGEASGADAPGGGLAGAILRVDHGPALATGALLVRPGSAEIADALLARAAGRGGPLALVATAEAVAACNAHDFRAAAWAVRCAGPAAPPPVRAEGGIRLRPVGVADWPAIAALDVQAFGAERRPALERLFGIAARAVLAVRGRQVLGYGLASPWAGAIRVGPLVAVEDGAGVALFRYLGAGHATPVLVDVPAEREALRREAARAGLVETGSAPILTRGGRPLPGKRDRVFALADPALG
jgi:hypothetical protein